MEPDLRGTLRLPRGVGAVLPDPALPRGPTPLETVMLCAPVDPVAAFAVLSEAGLSDQAEQPLSALSPLLHRCLHLACACAGGPGVLVLDGLFDDLSGRQAEVLMSIFAAMRAARGLAVVLTGQTTRALRPLANRVVTLDGRPAGIVSDIPNRPAPVMVTQTGR
jgi:ABC-type multidrug transport system ATPase subunit